MNLFSIRLLLTLLTGALLSAWAAAKPSILWVGSPKRTPILLDFPEDAKILSIKSANTGMLKVDGEKNFRPWGIWMLPLKVGKRFKLPAEYDRLCAAIDIRNKTTGDFSNTRSGSPNRYRP